MKKHTVVVGTMFALWTGVVSGSNVSGMITSDTTWAGNVDVTEEVTVSTNVTLTISAGTTVEFQGHYKLNIQGRIQALGMLGNEITFTAATPDDGWHGIRFDNVIPPAPPNNVSTFTYCKFLYGRASDGNDSNNVEDDYGGALFIKDVPALVMEHCEVRNNQASYAAGRGWMGGGIYCSGTDLVLVNSTISDNTARYGGGLYFKNCSPTVSNCLVRSNWAFDSGGMRMYGCTTGTVTDCSITDNYVSNNGEGSGIHLYQSSPSIVSCVISNNSGRWGAGIYVNGSSPSISDCTIVDNESRTEDGGGICILGGTSSPQIERCVISNNTAGRWGGGVYSSSSSKPEFVNCVIAGNTADYGGGVRVGLAAPTFKHCTIYGNTGVDGGGGIESYNCTASIFPKLSNCILWANTSPEGAQLAVRGATNPGAFQVGFSDVQGGKSGVHTNSGSFLMWESGNINDKPQFVSVASGNYRLLEGSPCADAGEMNAVDVDLSGIQRPLDSDNNGTPGWCMGAHELVHGQADTDNDGFTDWEEINAFNSSPLNDMDGMRLIACGGNTTSKAVVLSWSSTTGRTFTVKWTDDLTSPIWNDTDFVGVPGIDGTMFYTNALPISPTMYYRVNMIRP